MSDTPIKTLLQTYNLSQADAALILGITQPAISMYCSGARPTPEDHMTKLMQSVAATEKLDKPNVEEVPDDAAKRRASISREEYNRYIFGLEKWCREGGAVYDPEGPYSEGVPEAFTGAQAYPYKLYCDGYGRDGKCRWGRVYIKRCPGMSDKLRAVAGKLWGPATASIDVLPTHLLPDEAPTVERELAPDDGISDEDKIRNSPFGKTKC